MLFQNKKSFETVMRRTITTTLQFAFASVLLILSSKKIESGNRNMYNKHLEISCENKDQKLSFIYEDMTINVYGKWRKGFQHPRKVFTKDYQLKCNRSVRERPLHFVFNDDRLNNINRVEKLRELLRNKRMLLVGDSTMRILGLGICALLDLEVSIRGKT